MHKGRPRSVSQPLELGQEKDVMRSKALNKKRPEEIYSRQTALTDHSSSLPSDL